MIDYITFDKGKLNYDDDKSVMPMGDGYRLDIVHPDGDASVLEARKSTSYYSYNYIYNATGTNVCIGKCEDVENNAVILFFYNSSHNHGIARYYYVSGTSEIISSGSSWNFQLDYRIINPRIIGSGDDAMLTFTDGYNYPRCFNIADILGGEDLTVATMNMLKPAPKHKPLFVFYDNTSIEYNNVAGGLFQFAYRYLFDDGTQGAVSHWSDLAYSYRTEFPNGGRIINKQIDNEITLTFTVDYEYVSKIEIYVRNADVGSGTPGNWKLYDTLTASTPSVNYSFLNNLNGVDIDQDDFVVLYDNVPTKARVQELITGNVLVYGGLTDGRDNIDLDVELEVENTALDVKYSQDTSGATIYEHYQIIPHEDDGDNSVEFDIQLKDQGLEHFCRVTILLYNWFTDTLTKEEYVLESDFGRTTGVSGSYSNNSAVVDYFVNKINADTAYPISVNKILGGSSYYLFMYHQPVSTYTLANYYSLSMHVIAGPAIPKTLNYKDSCTSNFTLAYYDDFNKTGKCQISTDTTIDVPASTVSEEDYCRKIKYTINHIPPSWAKCAQWLHGDDSVGSFYELPVLCVNQGISGGQTRDVIEDGVYHKIDITQAVERVESYNVLNMGDYFTPQVGDRIRFKSKRNITTRTTSIITGVPDVFIEKIDDDYIYVKNLNKYSAIQTYLNDLEYPYMIIEVARPNNGIDSENIAYREVGDMITISGGYHVGDTQTQTSVLPAIGYIDYGNEYKRPVHWFNYGAQNDPDSTTPYYYYDALITMVNSPSSSVIYESNYLSKGRGNVVDSNFKEEYRNAFIWGGKYKDESLSYNDINRFSDGNMLYLDDKYGYLNDVSQVGWKLYAGQEKKITEIDVEVQTIRLPDGQVQTVVSDKVLGNKTPLVQDTGVSEKGGMLLHDGVLYFFDRGFSRWSIVANGEVIDITESAKMNNYAKTMSNTLYNASHVGTTFHIVQGIDPVKNMFIFSYIPYDGYTVDSDNAVTLGFHFPTQSWLSFYTFYGEAYFNSNNNGFYHLALGKPSKHHIAPVSVTTAYITVTFNKNINEYKRFIKLILGSEQVWLPNQNGDILIDEDSISFQNPESYEYYYGKMSSKLLEKHLILYNGEHRANFLRNMLDKDGSLRGKLYLYDGEELQGHSISTLKLRNTKTTTSKLKYVGIEWE